MIQVPAIEICDFCYEQGRQEQKIGMAVAEAMLRADGEKKGWTKCRWVAERNAFRCKVQEKMGWFDC